MKKIIFIFTMLLSMIAVSAAHASASKFYVPIHRSEVVTTATDLSEVIVANPEVADVYVHGKKSVSIIGKSFGQTSVRLFDEDSSMVRELEVQVTYDLPAIRKALHEFLPYERIGVEMVNTRIALTGEVSSAEVAASALEIAGQFVSPSASADQAASAQADDVSETLGAGIMNLLKIRSGQQVMLRIRFGEVTRSTIKALGASLNVTKTGGDLGLDIISPGSLPEGTGAAVRSLGLNYQLNNATSVTAALEALERDSLIKILAEPNLVTVSGEQAEFLSGGEVPIPTNAEDGQIQIEYKPFGVSLRFTPYVLSENRIRIQVQPEVSLRNDAEGVPLTQGGIVVPAFDVRRASTTVELAPGESFMIAGLLEDSLDSTVDQVPGINEIPVFSSLFRSNNYSREESELVIAVTPYLVDPLKSSDVRLPTDDFRPASFMESILYGALGSQKGDVRRISQTPTMEGPIGFMVD